MCIKNFAYHVKNFIICEDHYLSCNDTKKKCMALVFIFVQLTIAKVHSEKRIHSLGGIDYKSYETTEDSDKSGAPSTKVSIYLMQLEHCFLFVMKFGL